MAERALVTNIQRYSLHDGPGIRTVVFFKGCPLRCRWCCNPETQRRERELACRTDRCIGQAACGLCAAACPSGAIRFSREGRSVTDRQRCTACFRCLPCCPSRARTVEGKWMSADEILEVAERDAVFYSYGDGGLTLSGGEPLMQGGFLTDLLQKARKRRLHLAMETCGYGRYDVLAAAAASLNTILYDIKTLDCQRHILYTGRPNDLILQNFERLCADFPHLDKQIRTPLIPDFNDSPDELQKIRDLLHGRPNVRHETLPYHRLGEEKRRMLAR